MKFPCCPTTFVFLVAIGLIQVLPGSTVSNSNDSGPGSLRNAIASAVNGETIDFNPALNGATITLTSGSLAITGLTVEIDATSLADGVSLSGNNLSRVLLITGSSNATLRNLRIRNGQATEGNGGGVFLATGNLVMVGCTVSNCFSTYNGGAMFLAFGTTSTFDRCRVVANTAGNLGYGGGFVVSGAASTLIRNCIVSGNSNPFGGGIYTSNSSPALVNCTIQGNSGGGLRNESNADPVITNSIIWGNTNTGNIASQQIKNTNGSNPTISHSLIQGASGSASFADGDSTVWASGNLNGETLGNDPKFASAISGASAPHSGGDLRLLATSPALNIGNNLANVGPLDFAGTQRIKSGVVDFGSYEGGYVTFASLYPSLSQLGDENRNGISNYLEYCMGFNPSGTNALPAPSLSKAGNITLLTVNRRSNALDFTSVVQTNVTLNGQWSPIARNIHFTTVAATSVTADRDSLVYQLITTEPRRFYRQAFSGVN